MALRRVLERYDDYDPCAAILKRGKRTTLDTWSPRSAAQLTNQKNLSTLTPLAASIVRCLSETPCFPLDIWKPARRSHDDCFICLNCLHPHTRLETEEMQRDWVILGGAVQG